ncbi:methionine adenosyltransferase [Streptomyces sp. NPDC046881]|uniref:methionine adenosyltransferase n=1 Tax=Streptomyces sp. NPDC046881 TaxID=3155374 RepID=UPI0033E0E5AA
MAVPLSFRSGSQIAESVCAGHPDKVADRISDAVLDAFLTIDPYARVNCETLVTRDNVIATGQITANAEVDVDATVRSVLREIGYHDVERHGLSADTSTVRVLLDRQSREIADGVDRGGAGDSGIVYGYACDETPERLPLSCVLAHDIARRVGATGDRGVPALGPDGKVQVELSRRDGAERAIVVVSAQHPADLSLDELADLVAGKIVTPALEDRGVVPTDIHVNPAGTFVVGGTSADAGLTGRKLMVDAYGGLVRHGGGCCSGKDATKVDRSGAYVARYLAANVVAAGLAGRCRIGLAYAIGRPLPVWLDVECFGTATVAHERIAAALTDLVDLRVEAVIERLSLRTAAYQPTAAYGHFGRPEFSWERLDLADALRSRLGDGKAGTPTA